MDSSIHDKLDQILDLSKTANEKIDHINARVENIDYRVRHVEQNMDKLSLKALAAGGLGGAIVAVGVELIKAKLGG